VGWLETGGIQWEADYRIAGDGFGLPLRTGAGMYTYTVTGIIGEKASNYAFDLTEPLRGNLVIARRPITYEVGSGGRTYGETTLPAIELSNVLSAEGRDDVQVVVRLASDKDPGLSFANDARVPVGTYRITVIGLEGADARNYELGAGTDGVLEISRKTLNWSVPSLTTTYGALAEPQAVLTGVLPGDDVRGVVFVDLPGGGPLTAKTDAGRYEMWIEGLEGDDAGNYELASSGSHGWLTITPKPLTLDTTPIRFVYGDTAGGRALGTYPLPGLVGVLEGDDVALKADHLRLVRTSGWATSDLDIPVGTYRIRYNDALAAWDPLTGAASHNYQLTRETIAALNLQLIVQARPLRVVIENPVLEYGDYYVPTLRLEGLLSGDDVTVDPAGLVVLTASGGDILANRRFTQGVGEFIVRFPGLPAGASVGNYELDPYAGTIKVEPKTLRIGIDVIATFGDDLAAQWYDVPQQYLVLPADQVRVRIARLENGSLRYSTGPAGTYAGAVVMFMLDGPAAAKYRLAAVEDQTPGTLVVLKRPVTLAVLDSTRRYGDPVAVPVYISNGGVAGYDIQGNVTFRVYQGAGSQILTERTPVGTYRIEVAELDAPNYTLASSGHAGATIVINPRPVRYITNDWTVEYGNDRGYLGEAALFADDILPGDSIKAGPVVVYRRDAYPVPYLDADARYPLAIESLEGTHARNYVVEHVGSQQGMLTVTPRILQISAQLLYNGHALSGTRYTFGTLEADYGPSDADERAFSVRVQELRGLLPGDDARYSVLLPDLRWSSQGLLAAGTYAWQVVLEGRAARNYTIAGDRVVGALVIEPRPVTVTFHNETLTYGDPLRAGAIQPVLNFGGYDALFAGANLALNSLVISSPDGFRYNVDDLWADPVSRIPAGTYYVSLADASAPALVGSDAANFVLQGNVFGRLEVAPRPLYLTAPFRIEWVYGSVIRPRDLYGETVTSDGRPGVLPGDDVTVVFKEAWGLDEHNLGQPLEVEIGMGWPYLLNEVGRYGQFRFDLDGDPRVVANYVLIQPDYTITIVPRPLYVRFGSTVYHDRGTWYYAHTYGDPRDVEPGPYGGVLPSDGAILVGLRNADGHVAPINKARVGDYSQDDLVPIGERAYNYQLVIPNARDPKDVVRVLPRTVTYSIAAVVGQYGNYLACLDIYTCNGGRTLSGSWDHVWTPGLTTGAVTLHNVVPGDDVRPGAVIVVDLQGRTGRLEDVPPPGIYLQVIGELLGEDAANYRIAAEGNTPGLLEIHPQWVWWETFDGVYMPETGIVSYHEVSGQLAKGLAARLVAGGRELSLIPLFGLYRVTDEPNLPLHELARIEERLLRKYPGMYYVVVEGFAGPDGGYYWPFPMTAYSLGSAALGMLVAFPDSTLGLDFVGTVANPLAGAPITPASQLQQAGATGSAAAEAGVMAVARGQVFAGYKKGQFAFVQGAQAGAGAQAGVSLGVSSDAGSADVGATVYSPGVFAEEFAANIGLDDGVFTFRVRAGFAIGLFGLSVELGFSVNVDWFAEGVQAVGCALGAGGCPPSVEELARQQVLHALTISDPVELYRYLMENPEWSILSEARDLPADVRRAYEANRVFANEMWFLYRDLEAYARSQQELHQRFFEELLHDPAAAMETAQSLMWDYILWGGYNADLAQSIQSRMNALGVRPVVKGNQVVLEWVELP